MQLPIPRISHFNCATLKPIYPRLTGVIWCLLVKHPEGYVLIDTGIGSRDFMHPHPVMRLFIFLMGIQPAPQQAIVNQLKAMGILADDVTHIILTHTHLDHAGGLPDFPDALVHISAGEHASLEHPHKLLDRGHIRTHFAHKPNWVVHTEADTQWFGFDAITVLPGILFIPLPGHTSGHCGIAVQVGEEWLLHAGDAISPFHSASDPDGRGESSGYRMNWIPASLVPRILGDQTKRIAKLIDMHGDVVTVISAHDSIAFQQLTREAA